MENRKQLKKGPNVSRKSITVTPENYEYLFICFPGNPLFLKYISRLDKPPQSVRWAISYVTSWVIHKKPTSYTGIFSNCGNQHQGVI